MPPFDLEKGKLSIRVSRGVYYQLLADIEDFRFEKSNGETNPNAFYNRIIPTLIEYRDKKRSDLREYFENNIRHCIIENYQDKVLDFVDDIFDYNYFNDNKEYYHNETIHFRLNKENIKKLQGFFDILESLGRNKTTYLRNLLNEYANMKKDKREEICFACEYDVLNRAVNEKYLLNCKVGGENYSLIPYKIDMNYVDGSVYLIAVEKDKPYICHTFRLSWLRDLVLKGVYQYTFSDLAIGKLEYVIEEYDYTNKRKIDIRRLKTN